MHGCIAAPAGSLAAKVVQDTIDGVLPPVVRRFRGRTVALEASKQLVALDVPIHSPQVAELLRLRQAAGLSAAMLGTKAHGPSVSAPAD